MFKSIGTFASALIIASTMAVSTAPAAQFVSNTYEAMPPIPMVRSSADASRWAALTDVMDRPRLHFAETGHSALHASDWQPLIRRSFLEKSRQFFSDGLTDRHELALSEYSDRSHFAETGSIWNSAIHASEWQALVSRSLWEPEAPRQLFFKVRDMLTERHDFLATDTVGLWTLDDIKLVAPLSHKKHDINAPVSELEFSLAFIKQCVGECDEALALEAAQFHVLMKNLNWQPDIWGDDGEIAFEWIRDDKHAIVSFDGGGRFGYTLLRGDTFEPGIHEDPPVGFLPQDLREYLEAA